MFALTYAQFKNRSNFIRACSWLLNVGIRRIRSLRSTEFQQNIYAGGWLMCLANVSNV